jgi:hypothetical protein
MQPNAFPASDGGGGTVRIETGAHSMSFTLTAFTLFHVALSVIGIVAGLIVLFGMLNRQRFDGATAVFLWTTVATSATGFLFPFHGFKPSYVFGILSLLLLPAAIFARYRRSLAGRWRPIYVVTAMTALYLNVFVLIFQLFLKIPAMRALAPTQSEPPFAITQLTALILFIVLTGIATWRFHPDDAPETGLPLQIA